MSSQIKKNILALLVLSFFNVSYADDLDVLMGREIVDANVLFVMDLSGSMNYLSGSSSETRLQVLSSAFKNIIEDDDFSEINIGLATFSGAGQNSKGANTAHGISYPVSPIIGTDAQSILTKAGFVHPGNSYMPPAGANDSRQYLGLLSSDQSIWRADGSTPIVDALYEASLYFRAQDVDLGRYEASDIRSAHPATYNGSLTTISTTTTPACDATSRVSCTKGSCGTSESCTTNTVSNFSYTDTGGCTLRTGNRQHCGREGVSCGLGTDCRTTSNTYTRFCYESADIAACEAVNPTWYGCLSGTSIRTTTNAEGQTVTMSLPDVRCQVDESWVSCDAADAYSCPQDVESCTQCPEDETSYLTTGTARYKSPITQACATNAIILLTDGEPTSNSTSDRVASMIGSSYANNCNTAAGDGRCGPELVKYMATEDHAGGSTAVPSLDGIQNVQTYAVGLNLDITDPIEATAIAYLNDISMNGNGNPAIIADSKAELTKAFKDSINDVVSKARSFGSPSYSIDKSTLLTNGSYVYLPVFDQSATLWPGNLKKYKLVKGVLTDADNKPALDVNDALLATARDLWSSDVSEDAIRSGGAANKITPNTRNIKTDDGTQLVSVSNSISNEDFGLSSTPVDTAYKDVLVKFISGLNPSDDSLRNHMGDIIHSKPTQLELASGRKIIFVGTNEGYLHAINDYANETHVANGTEAFAYMPKELLKNIKGQYENIPSASHRYGVDGLITTWIDESANTNVNEVGNKIVDVASGERAYIFFGLRRGGGSYTALEVTNPDSPRLVWSKNFGDADSWSQAVLTRLKWSPHTTPKPVLIIGGGFNDDAAANEVAGGNNVYVIDAETGDIVWDTSTAFTANNVTNYSGSSLPNAVPARIRVIDVDKDNSIDRMYFGDTGGNIWRVDLNAADYDTITSNDNDVNKATLHRFAALGGNGVNNRKFFEEPDIAIYKNAGKLVTSIAIGSGDRPKPTSGTIQDKFFVLYDSAVLDLPTDSLITLASGNIKTVPISINDANDADFKGWQKPLAVSTGEKVLSSALTFQGKVLFTSFSTLGAATDSCKSSSSNENKVYVLDLFSGTEDGVFTHPGGEILATPKVIYPPDGICEAGDCKRAPKIGFGRVIEDFPTEKAADGTELLDPAGNAISAGGSALERVYWINSEE